MVLSNSFNRIELWLTLIKKTVECLAIGVRKAEAERQGSDHLNPKNPTTPELNGCQDRQEFRTKPCYFSKLRRE